MVIRQFKTSIEFQNNGQLSFFFVGTGGAFSKKFFQNNVLIIKGRDHILVDCGTACPYSLSTFDARITDIKNFLITHSHADHAGGLEEVAAGEEVEVGSGQFASDFRIPPSKNDNHR